MTSVETRIQDAVLTAIGNLVIPRVEMAIKSANAPSGRSVDGALEPDQRNFWVISKAYKGTLQAE